MFIPVDTYFDTFVYKYSKKIFTTFFDDVDIVHGQTDITSSIFVYMGRFQYNFSFIERFQWINFSCHFPLHLKETIFETHLKIKFSYSSEKVSKYLCIFLNISELEREKIHRDMIYDQIHSLWNFLCSYEIYVWTHTTNYCQIIWIVMLDAWPEITPPRLVAQKKAWKRRIRITPEHWCTQHLKCLNIHMYEESKIVEYEGGYGLANIHRRSRSGVFGPWEECGWRIEIHLVLHTILNTHMYLDIYFNGHTPTYDLNLFFSSHTPLGKIYLRVCTRSCGF